MNRPSPPSPVFVSNEECCKLRTDHELSEIISTQYGGNDDLNRSPLFPTQSKPSQTPSPKYTLLPALLNDETIHPGQLPNKKRKRHSTTLPNKLVKRSPLNNEHQNVSSSSSSSENHSSEKSNRSCVSPRNIVNNNTGTISSSSTHSNYQSTSMGHPHSTLLNKATLCDSTNSK